MMTTAHAPCPRPQRRLTVLQERFVAAYRASGHAATAARAAGYSETTATHSAARLLRAPHIRAALAEARAAEARHGAKLHERVVQELERIAFAPLDDESVRMADKLRALDLLGRMAERSLRYEKRADAPQAVEETAEETTEKTGSPSITPKWQEQMRRGMERVERGRRQDAERRRQEEQAIARRGDVQPHGTANEKGAPSCPPSTCLVPPSETKPPPQAPGPLFARSKPLPVPVERHPESPFPLYETSATLMEEANRNFDPYAF